MFFGSPLWPGCFAGSGWVTRHFGITSDHEHNASTIYKYRAEFASFYWAVFRWSAREALFCPCLFARDFASIRLCTLRFADVIVTVDRRRVFVSAVRVDFTVFAQAFIADYFFWFVLSAILCYYFAILILLRFLNKNFEKLTLCVDNFSFERKKATFEIS